jgi:hypothetical protein
MSSRDFCYWLQGFFELATPNTVKGELVLSPEQVSCVKKHLQMVFVHEIDPSYPNQKKLNEIHSTDGVTIDVNEIARC